MTTAREYLRVSKDDTKTARSPKEQHDAHLRAAQSQGWSLGEPYGEIKDGRHEARSASRYALREREGFKELIADLENDTFGADVLMLWTTSRGSRRAGEWLNLLDLLIERRVKVYITADDTIFDPTKSRDWKTLADDAVDAEYQTLKSSADIKRALAANADNGRPHGRPLLGYARQYDPNTGELLGQAPDPETAPRIRDMFARLARGESIRSIVRLWGAAGHLNGAGKPYDHTFITRLARNPQYAGYRLHEAGRTGGQLPSDKARLIEAAWEPIVDRETFWAVQEILNAPGRRSNREGRAKWWLTMIARCHVCGGPTVARKLHGKHMHYACQTGHCSVRMDGVDEVAESLIVSFLERENITKDTAELEHDNAELQRVRSDIATLSERLKATEADYDADLIDGRRYKEKTDKLNKEIRDAEAKERELTAPDILGGLFEMGPGAAERWRSLTLERRRKIASILLTPEHIGQLRLRTANYYREPAMDRIVWR
ncbi:recombinase family protein [Nocardioides sp. NPDC000445]|uniref:recombinase family protein n=1 Tax=Nocardioides sp. NPDC000445 TaxID=3154257 RepID=UPI00331EF37A